MSMRITGLQQAQDALRKELKKLEGGSFALVGIHEDAGAIPDGELSLAGLGALQHYGNADIPARPWLDVGVLKGSKEYIAIVAEGLEKGLDQEKILNQVGASAVGFTQKYITDLKNPPNAPYTIKKKGSDNPLIDTGAMRQSVTWTLTNKKPEEGL